MESKRQKKNKNNIISFIPNGDYYFNKALKAMEKEHFDKAYKYMKRATELSPDDAHVLLHYGIFEMERQNFEKAYELIHTAYSLDPSDAENVFFLAEISGYIGFMNDAKKFAEKYLELEPDGIYAQQAFEIIDFFYLEQDEIEENEHDPEKFIAQEKARKYMEDGQFQQAIEVLENLIDLYPELWQAYNNLALCYFYIGEIEQSRALLNEVLRNHHGNLHALCNLAIIAYYEKSEEELKNIVELLKKIVPFDWEDRYKLGATLALVGENELAYKWLYSMWKNGHMNVAGFYFWLAHAAYFSGEEVIAKQAWDMLLQFDPSKRGLEPWVNGKNGKELESLENDRTFILEKINSEYTVNRLFGFFLLSKSIFKQEIIAHPKHIDISQYNGIEKLSLAYALQYKFNMNNQLEKAFYNSMQVVEKLYEQKKHISKDDQYLYQMWFVLCEIGLKNMYTFKNTNAIAAAVDYMFHTTTRDNVTKKEFAEKYGTTVPTLTKYMQQLIKFLPFDL